MTKTTHTILAAFLLVASLAVGAAAPAAAAVDAGTTPTPALQADNSTADDSRDADLAIRQPAYIDESVRERTENGSHVYVVQGDELLLTPQNIPADNVLDAAVLTEGGELTYDDQFGAYVFRPSAGEGTYDLRWRVAAEQEVTIEDGNETTTEVRTVEREYTARVRVDGGTDMQHLSASEAAEREHNRELGAEVNATVGELRESNLPFAQNSGDDYEVFQAMTDRYVNTGSPMGLLTGNLGAIVAMLVLTMGGWFLIIVTFGGFGSAIYTLRKKLNIHETVEAEEGQIADRQAEVDRERRERTMQNIDWNDWYEDDAMADWMRDSGENAHDGVHRLTAGELRPAHWMRDRLAVMGAAGYQADVTRAETDGGDADDADVDAEIVDATLATPDAEGDDLEPIAELDVADLTAAVDWGDSVLWDDFRLPEADVDFSELDRTPLTMDLDATMSEANLEAEKFPNKRVAGRALREFVESVAQHEYTDVEGKPQTTREAMNNWLKALQKASDRHQMPVHAIGEAVEQALINHDPNEEARQAAREVRAGAD